MNSASVKAQRLKEREPVKGDRQTSLIVASRRSLTPWKEVAELVDLPVSECKTRLEKHSAVQEPTTPTPPVSVSAYA